jgi:oligosaccharyltransferase complex subunit alpha (ribophorin I)
MLRMRARLSLLAAAAVLLLSCACASAAPVALSSFATGNVVNQAVTRVVDLRTHIEEVNVLITVKNTGNAALKQYLLAVPGDKAPRLAYVEASQGKTKLAPPTQITDGVSGLPSVSDAEGGAAALSNATFFSVQLASSVAAGATSDLRVLLVFARTQRPYPESIEQADQQLVMWEDSSLFYSPYATTSQESQIKLASSRIESFTKGTGKNIAKRTGEELRYGPFTDTPAFARSAISVHSVNNAPFVTFTSLSKDIEVSHWGNVAVQDNVLLSHTGAKLRGAFTRFDYERSRTGDQAPASFRTLVAELPRTAKDIYYRDCIGNVSTSHVRKPVGGRDAHTRVEIDPRFPMFGGWNADFMLGYNLPSQHYLSVDNTDASKFVLNISFGAPVASAAIDELTVRVILPEGATDIQWVSFFTVLSCFAKQWRCDHCCAASSKLYFFPLATNICSYVLILNV